ncbi:Cyclic di-GMP phosphodiesterase response regulator RpfG [Posidoniimonas polymericola]|uniref:Cyclic di-GMP phosphodiesterase response regulator RpfG n=1 Tax=Posidoniimonas polymericola TaxID=2528002 RepID=A0A5C5YGR9_9BACT|nr:HD-GYP domain-containing protein [Posidoniimonas polymericola]TWT73781.1 Cyclic di-GMP phosphodiesterase response regulator RpfG [Posidoniimonas polymericola]
MPQTANPLANPDQSPEASLGQAQGWCAPAAVESFLRRLEEAFDQSFFVYDTATDTVHRTGPDDLLFDIHSRLAVCDHVTHSGRPEVLEDFAPLLILAAPLHDGAAPTDLVAVSTFLTSSDPAHEQLEAAAQAVGAAPVQAAKWAAGREVWNPRGVIELAKSLCVSAAQQAAASERKQQMAEVSSHLLSTFEELNMLHRLTERLSIASSEAELGSQAIQWLADVVPVESVVIANLPDDAPQSTDPAALPLTIEQAFGPAPLDAAQLGELVGFLGPQAAHSCVVLNQDATAHDDWPLTEVRELISVPIRSGDKTLGWVMAFNHTGGRRDNSFGSVEASLVSSVAAILGVHAGNCRLYAEQKEFFSAMVRALSSAIDAKDPYTSGHSERVAELSVCLADELGCTEADRQTIYLAGLLHDIGKIGIEDQVLRKVGRLTAAEYEHIKTHPELGHKILAGIKQLDHVLPLVLHHHEAWDGSGYPGGLVGEECPRLARVLAVADSIDAMGSDRPYRPGMPDSKLDAILRDGAGRQWESDVVDAVFRVREKVRAICQTGRKEPLAPDQEWLV